MKGLFNVLFFRVIGSLLLYLFAYALIAMILEIVF